MNLICSRRGATPIELIAVTMALLGAYLVVINGPFAGAVDGLATRMGTMMMPNADYEEGGLLLEDVVPIDDLAAGIAAIGN